MLNLFKCVKVACWAIGEFGDLLLATGDNDDNGDVAKEGEAGVIAFFEQWLLFNIQLSVATRAYALLALQKLSVRFSSESSNRYVGNVSYLYQIYKLYQ